MRSTLLAFLLLLSCLRPAISAETRALDVHVVRVFDGDTIEVVDSNKLDHRIRLAGIDAPEKSQAFSERARQHLAALIHDKDVRISWSKKDQYGRMVAKVSLQSSGNCSAPSCEAGSTDVNLLLIAAGLAWHYKEYEREQSAVDRRTYAAAEQTARSEKHGLWADTNPVAPWDWRHAPKAGRQNGGSALDKRL